MGGRNPPGGPIGGRAPMGGPIGPRGPPIMKGGIPPIGGPPKGGIPAINKITLAIILVFRYWLGNIDIFW